MNFATLMRRAAERYIAAKQAVLREWQAPCGCKEPGSQPQCESCPSLAVFENLVRDQINSRAHPDQEQARLQPPVSKSKALPSKPEHSLSSNLGHSHYDHERSRKTTKKTVGAKNESSRAKDRLRQ